jgi:lipopolysaccharide export system permease protein
MHASSTLSRYIGRQFVMWFIALLLIVLAIILVLDMVELLRRAGSKPNITFGLILEMSLLKLPQTGQQVFPFVMLFSGMFTFWQLTRSNELIVARAVGVSAWQFLTPVLIAAAVIGLFKVTLINPVGAVFIAKYDHLEEKYLKLRSSSLDVTRAGLWLRQESEDGYMFVHAETVRPERLELIDVSVFSFGKDEAFQFRVDAPRARLAPGRWELSQAVIHRRERPGEALDSYSAPTSLDMTTIAESFAPPDTISFWALPRFIATLESTGFTAVRHRIHYQALLAQPLLYCAMVLFAAAFSLRMTRRGGALIMVSGGVATGFVVFLGSDIVRTLGMSEVIPVSLAAWSPVGVALLVSLAALLHQEDG